VQAILAVTIPFFALVLGGYLAARQHALPEEAIPGLNAFVLYFALPCMLYRFGASLPVAELLNPALLAVYTSTALLIVFFTIGVTLSPVVQLKDAAFGALVAAFPNTGFMGVPLLVAMMGTAAAGPVLSIVLVDLFLTTSLCIALAQAHEAAGQGSRAALANALRGVLSNPLPWSIALGALSSASGYTLVGPLNAIVKMLGDSASPVALFTIGAVLWREGRHAHTRTPVRRYLPVALIKLLLHPLLVWAIGLAAIHLGASLTPFQLTALVLAAALPSASNVSLLAERFGADNGRVARIILASTVIAFASFTLLAWLFGVTPG
jgi:malonate transporter and related proteins